MLSRKITESPSFPPKTWKSRYLLQWKSVRPFSKILCTWVDFLIHEPPEYSFLYILRILRHTEWIGYSYSRNTHICSFGIQRSLLKICALANNIPHWDLYSGYFDVLRILKCYPMGSDFLHLLCQSRRRFALWCHCPLKMEGWVLFPADTSLNHFILVMIPLS